MKFQRLVLALIVLSPLAGGVFSRAADRAESTTSPNLRYYYAVPPVAEGLPQQVDVCVYGATPAGFTAGIQAARMGKKAVVLEFGTHVGGLTTGGLTATDGGSAAGGIAREFYARVGQTGFKPAAAEQAMKDMLKEAGVPLLFEHRLASVKKDGNRITMLKCENGAVFQAKMFIDATYEADLVAAAGVSFHLGREANSVYNETINGIQLGRKAHQFDKDVSPYVVENDPKSGLLWSVSDKDPGKTGDGDKRIQAYNFRMQFEKGGLPFPKPPGYDAKRYELLLRYIKAGGGPGVYPHPGDNNNNGGFSTDHIGFNYEWPDGPEMGDLKATRDESYFHRLYELREKMYQDHVNYQQGLVWFLVHDERVPAAIRTKIGEWGMARHSFQETGGWPHALYVREGRRLLGDFVMTEHYCRGKEVAEDSVGLAQYTMDSHNTQRYIAKDPKTGKAVVRNEGDVQVGIPGPYPIAYRALVPKEAECANLFVPVCLSSTHIAYGSIRMEPVFMVLGQSSATAACMAIDSNIAVQKVPYDKLKERLLADKQTLVWTGPKKAIGLVKAKLDGIVVDNDQAKLVGDWGQGHGAGFVGEGYLHDENTDKGKKSATFNVKIKDAGTYEVRISYAPNSNRATNVPVTVSGFKGEPKTIKIDQKKAPPIDKLFISLGKFEFDAGATATILITTADTNGHVIVDAVQLLK
jgi:thioredoxin reductase